MPEIQVRISHRLKMLYCLLWCHEASSKPGALLMWPGVLLTIMNSWKGPSKEKKIVWLGWQHGIVFKLSFFMKKVRYHKRDINSTGHCSDQGMRKEPNKYDFLKALRIFISELNSMENIWNLEKNKRLFRLSTAVLFPIQCICIPCTYFDRSSLAVFPDPLLNTQ